MKILCICLSATIQRTLLFSELKTNKVNRSQTYLENASGKAINTARVLNQLENNSADIICPAGKNNYPFFKKLLKKDKLKFIPVLHNGNIRQCWTLLTPSGETTEIISEEPSDLIKNQIKFEKKILSKIQKIIHKYSAVCLCGSTPKAYSADIATKICTLVKKSNKILLVDFCGESLLRTLKTSTPDFIKINETEFCTTFNLEKLTQANLKEIAESFNTNFIITRGADPTFSYIFNKEYVTPVHHVEIKNTTACGDSFNAGFLYSYMNKNNIEDALLLATQTASKNAESLIPGSII